MALAEHIGRFDAHRTIRSAIERAAAENSPLAEVLSGMPEVTEHLSPAQIARALTPESYLGAAEHFVRDALVRHARERE
jgi:3-carboxy-cis,cis-muconate cycloisomerase